MDKPLRMGSLIKQSALAKAVLPVQFNTAQAEVDILRANSNENKSSDENKRFHLPGVDYKIDSSGNVTATIHINPKGYSPVVQVDINHRIIKYMYFVQDHLGSPIVTVDPAGNTQAPHRYDAWGQMIEATGVAHTPTNDDENKRGYTGHELYEKFNMGQWNGRIFDYRMGLFTQADKGIQGSSMPALNRYGLGQHNNPNVKDPSGWVGEYVNETIDLFEKQAGNMHNITYDYIQTGLSVHASFKDLPYEFFTINGDLTHSPVSLQGTMFLYKDSVGLRPKKIPGVPQPESVGATIPNPMYHDLIGFKLTGRNTVYPIPSDSLLGFWSDGYLNSHWEITRNYQCNCHGYSLGAGVWISNPEQILNNENYFTRVHSHVQRGDIVAYVNTSTGKMEHSAVITEPRPHVPESQVRHMPGVTGTRSTVTALHEAWHEPNHHYELFRPRRAVRRIGR